MLRKILFISLALLLGSSVLGFTEYNKTVLAASHTIDADVQRQILAATVRIALIAPLTDNQGNPQVVTVDGQKAAQFTVGEGLGTLTRSGSDVFILTHDHWTLLTPNLHKVQFHNVAGKLLLEVSGEDFQQMVRYRDGGTMVLSATDELVDGLTAVSTGNSQSVDKNSIVHLAYRQPHNGEISVAALMVKKEITYRGQLVFKLASLNGEFVVNGNSGGGVLFNGRLIGNMWGAVLQQPFSLKIGGSSNPFMQTSSSVAAQMPMEVLVQ